MGTVLENALIDSIALKDAAEEAGITAEQARRFAAALGEMPGDQVVRIVGDAARIARCGRERMRKKQDRLNRMRRAGR